MGTTDQVVSSTTTTLSHHHHHLKNLTLNIVNEFCFLFVDDKVLVFIRMELTLTTLIHC